MTVIIVIDPHPILRLGLIQLLSETFTEATIRAEDYTALQQERNKPEVCDLILLTSVSEDSICPHLKYATQAYMPRFILLLSEPPANCSPPPYHHHPLVRGLISKKSSPELIKASVQLVLAGGTCFPHLDENPYTLKPSFTVPTLATVVSSASAIQPNEAQLLGLTKRQYEVLVLLAEGDPLKTIARRLEISLATTKSHTETIYQRLNVSNRNAAVYTAVNRGATLGWSHSGFK